jgi:transposase
LVADHLAWCVLDAVGELDLSAFYGVYRLDGHGRPAFDPAMMVSLLLYGYAVGERSSRGIERACQTDVAYRVIAANQIPDHATIARFRVRHQDALGELFGQVLGICGRAGMVSVGLIALDGTRMTANASVGANRRYEQIAAEILAEADAIDAAEDEQFGAARGDELPAELADPVSRRARLREAKRRMDAEHEATQVAFEQHLAARAAREAQLGHKLGGRRPTPPPEHIDPKTQINVVDPDSRPVRTRRGFIQGYNAQAVCTEQQIIIAAELEIGGVDQGLLEPMIAAVADELAAAGVEGDIEIALADAGYWNGQQIQKLWGQGIAALVPPDGSGRKGKGDPQRTGGIYDFVREVLSSEHGKRRYRQRAAMIEPIFGQTKHNRRTDRFQRRGKPACRSEWRLITATHNLLKYWHTAWTPATA